MVIKWDVTIPKLSGDQTRRTFIYLPESYEQDPERRYPVLYMFDGHNLFFDGDATYGTVSSADRFVLGTDAALTVNAGESGYGLNELVFGGFDATGTLTGASGGSLGFTLFGDVACFFAGLCAHFRGEEGQKYGVCAQTGYVDWLLAEGEITEEEAKAYADFK